MTFGPGDAQERGEPDFIEFPGSGLGPRHRHWRLLALLGVAVVALAGGGAVAYVTQHSASHAVADSSSAAQAGRPDTSPSPSVTARPGRPFRRGFGGPGLGGLALGFGGLGGVIHGQLTEPRAGGGYQTLDIQRGTVTDVSLSSISVTSADGFAATYAVASSTEVNAQAAGIGTVKMGDNVEVVATVSNGKATAASIIDATSIRSSRRSFGVPVGPPDGSRSPAARS